MALIMASRFLRSRRVPMIENRIMPPNSNSMMNMNDGPKGEDGPPPPARSPTHPALTRTYTPRPALSAAHEISASAPCNRGPNGPAKR